ncbi:MAG: NnrU family protein [Burkholderiales bacterium]
MTILVVGLVLFLGVHSVRIFAEGFRSRSIARIGPNAWKGLYTVISLTGFALIVWGYGLSRAEGGFLWHPPRWTFHVTALLMMVSFILLVAAYVPGNGIKARVGHPMVAGVKVWAFAHLLSNGRVGDVVLFGAFMVWAILNFSAARRRDRAAGVTSASRGAGRTVVAVVVGVVAYLAFTLAAHRWLIGVRPF